ncbi:MAG: flavin-containing monooxygenase [Minwuia sp.]|uniref:flavin-containing monooxygenase n=1 Tax=Minwuia sp. TaxID=2493630 RepID=UPI003A844E19
MADTPAPVIDKDALKQRYAEEREKRIRADGNDQYQELKGQFAHYAGDPYTAFTERDPVTDHVTFAFVGGGFAGLVTGARLKEAGIDDVRLIEKGGDFGGTWYWNRYPGAQCDTASMIYMPLLEETGHMPSEKYAHGPEIRQHCVRIAKQFGLYEHALFHTEVEQIRWDDDGKVWEIATNRGDRFTASFVGMGTGPLHVPKLPGIPGIENFRGHSFHTSRWDYDYTGGDADGAPMTKLADKRVAIIGTGATSVQCVPHLARACKRLYVFQRTPSSVDVRDNRPIDPDWFGEIATPGWQDRWLENFTANQGGLTMEDDWVMDGWTEISRRVRTKIMQLPPGDMTIEKMMAVYEDSDFEKMEEIRRRAEAVVNDPGTAEKLKAWYRQLCKRPCFHDDYLLAFNEPATVLVDTDGKGVERITETGVVAGGNEYEVDCIIYASGFEVGTEWTRRSGFDLQGRDGLKLSGHWSKGMRTLHGVHVHGFPNAFFVQPTQGANLISNVPHNLTEAGRSIGMIVAEALKRGAQEVEVTAEAEQKWIEMLLTAPDRLIGGPDCTPGYYNNEGQPRGPEDKLNFVGYPAGALAYFKYLKEWRNSGEFKGLEFR